MHILSVPVVAAISIILSSGLYHVLIYFRLRQNRENLTFALTCFSFSVYGACCAGLYSAGTLAEGAAWQRAQVSVIFISMVLLLWFVHDFTRMVSKRALHLFTALGITNFILSITLEGEHSWTLSRALIKEVQLPFGITGTYYEVELGTVMVAACVSGVVAMGYILWVCGRFYREGPKEKTRPLILGMLIVFFAVANDVAVSLAWYSFVYTLEYSFLGISIFMSMFMVNEVVQASHARQKIKENEERYRVLAENAGFTMWTTDLDLNLTHINPSYMQLTGFSVQDAMKMGFDGILTPESVSLCKTVLNTQYALELENTTQEPGSVNFEVMLRHKTLAPFWAEITATFLRDGQNGPTGIVGLTRDISSLKAAEEDSLFIQRAVDSSSDAIAMCDAEFNHFYHNEAFTRLFGYITPQELMDAGGVVGLYADPQDVNAIAKGLVEEGMWTGEIMAKSKKGRDVLVNLRTNIVADSSGRFLGLIGTHTDVTERNAFRLALQGSEERYRLVAENTSDVIWTTDLNLKWTYVSPAIYKMRGYTPEEVLSQRITEVLTQESALTVMESFVGELEMELENPGEEPRTVVLELEFLKKDGGTVWGESSCTFMRDEDGRVVGVMGITRDSTERRKAEAERLKLEDRLQQAQKLEAMGTLAGGVAHDFNNLLMGIQGNLSLMRLGMEENNPLYTRIKNIEQHIKNASGVTRQLLGFARSGKYQVTTTNFNELATRTSGMFGRTKKEIQIKRNFQDDLWPVEVDHGQVEQVLLNLLVNSWQAMPQGGVITLRSENVHLDSGFCESYSIAPGKYVRLSVTDSGVGMSPEVQKRVFDPFFTTKEISRGTGLGLASAYGIIQNHGGIITVYSQEGYGATFNIYLPASPKAILVEAEPKGAIVHGNETILLIDDEDIILDTGGEILNALGYNTQVAQSPGKALEIFTKHHDTLDLVIMDMIMPEMHGTDLYDELVKIDPGVKVLLSSGYSVNGQATSILKKGCDGFIQKPFNLEQLSYKIREILDGK